MSRKYRPRHTDKSERTVRYLLAEEAANLLVNLSRDIDNAKHFSRKGDVDTVAECLKRVAYYQNEVDTVNRAAAAAGCDMDLYGNTVTRTYASKRGGVLSAPDGYTAW